MEIDFDRVKPGDKGYEGDVDGAWIVEGVTPNGVDLRHESGEWDPKRINWIAAAEPDWRWFRD